MENLVGKAFGRYHVQACIAEGRTATVYRAAHSVTGDLVALKVLHPTLAAEGKSRQRFLREVQAARHLAHPHIVPVLDAGEQDDRLYLVMPFLAGGTLRDRLGTAPLPT